MVLNLIKKPIDLGLLVLRVGFSGMMLSHGVPKINTLFESPITFADPIGLGETPSLVLTLIGEVAAPILVLVGFKTKWAAIPVMTTMLVAAFVVHLNDPLATKKKPCCTSWHIWPFLLQVQATTRTMALKNI